MSCAVGVEWVGYTNMCFGVFVTLSSWVIGHTHEWIGDVTIYTVGFVVNLIGAIWMLLWQPSGNASEFWYFFAIPALWGVGDAVWGVHTVGT